MEKKERSFNEDQLYAASSFIDTAKEFLEFDFTNSELIQSKLDVKGRDKIKSAINLWTTSIKKTLEKLKIKTENFDILSTSIMTVDFTFNLKDAAYKLRMVKSVFEQLISIKDLAFEEFVADNFFPACSAANTSIMNIYTAILMNDDFSLAREALNRIEDIENKARQAAGITAVYDISKYYNKNYNSYSNDIFYWFFCIIVNLFVLSAGIIKFDIGFALMHEPLKELLSKEMMNYSYIMTRITFVAVFLITLFFCFKNFNIAKHNSITYEYKEAVMKTLPAIFTQYPDADKKMFYEKLADFLFKPHDTGMGKSTDSGMPYDKVIDLLTKTVGKSKEGG